MAERKPKPGWIVEYRCGCTDEGRRKADLLNYCGKHGDDARNWYRVPLDEVRSNHHEVRDG